MTQLRILIDPPLAGADNMADDEAMLAAVGAGSSAPTLRLYRWAEPTLSLGYFQKWNDAAGLAAGLLPIVRRPTGGGAILHADELTYSLILPVAGLPEHISAALAASAGPSAMYRRMHELLWRACTRLEKTTACLPAAQEPLAPMATPPANRKRANHERCNQNSGLTKRSAEPFLCFQRLTDSDLVSNGLKLAGSSQRRTKTAVLQHGSIILSRHPLQPSASVQKVLGRRASFDELAQAVLHVLAEVGLNFTAGGLSQAERELLEPLRQKHCSEAWLRQR